MSVHATYKFYIDWNEDGDFSDPDEDITNYILSVNWDIGADDSTPSNQFIGDVRFILKNGDGRFDNNNNDSNNPLYGLVIPGKKIKGTMQIDSDPAVTIVSGILKTVNLTVGETVESSTAELVGQGMLGIVRESNAEMPLIENTTVGAIIQDILEALGLTGSEFSIDTGQSTLSKWWKEIDDNDNSVIQDLLNAELGVLRETKDGKLSFEDRHHLFASPHDVSEASYGYGGTLNMWNVRPVEGSESIFNDIKIDVKTFNHSDENVLVVLSDVVGGQGGTPLKIEGLSSLVVDYKLSSKNSPSNYVGVYSWSTSSPNIDYEVYTSPDRTGTDITTSVSPTSRVEIGPVLRVTYYNASANDGYFTMNRARGIAIVLGDPISVVAKDTNENLKRYGDKVYPSPSIWETDVDEAQDKADYLLALCKTSRPKIAFSVVANYDAVHLAEVQACDIQRRIHINALNHGLMYDDDFIIHRMSHSLTQENGVFYHIMDLVCTKAPSAELGASGTAYTPKTIPTDDKVPDLIKVAAILSRQRAFLGLYADKYNVTIDKAEFRARFVENSGPAYVDLRISSEGGTFVHNGSTQLIITDWAASSLGTSYIVSAATSGRWYFAGRLHNVKGWSVWSDGNETPQIVKQYIDSGDTKFTDLGPPSKWDVSLKPGPQSNTAIAYATRPAINGKRIWQVMFQFMDVNTGAWVNVSSNTPPSDVYYNGAEIAHVYDPEAGTLTKPSGNFGDAATYGGLMLINKIAGSYDDNYCTWRWLTPDQFSGNVISNVTAINLDMDPDIDGKYQDVRIRICKTPADWSTDGYFGPAGWIGDGAGDSHWQNATNGDVDTEVFESLPFSIPDGLAIEDIVVRCFFGTDYCISHGNITSQGVIISDTDTPSASSSITIVTNIEDSRIPKGMMAFRIVPPSTNADSIKSVEIALVTTPPGHGPYSSQRTANPTDVLASGEDVSIAVGQRIIPITIDESPTIEGNIFQVNKPDTDQQIDGHFIKVHGADYIELDSPLVTAGTFDWNVVKPYWDLNPWEHTFSVPNDFLAWDLSADYCQTKPVKIFSGTRYAVAICRNYYGVEGNATPGVLPIVSAAYDLSDPTAEISVIAGMVEARSITSGDLAISAAMQFGVVCETFSEGTNTDRKWAIAPYYPASAVTYPSNGGMGGLVFRAAGFTYLYHLEGIPFNPNQIYRIQYRVRRTATGDPGQHTFYTVINAYNAASEYLGNVYLEIINSESWTINEWQVCTVFFKGTGTGGTGTAADPYKLTAGAVYFIPILYLNGIDDTGGNVTELDSVIIQAFDEDAHARVYTAINPDGTINTTQLSGDIAIANLNIAAQGWTQTSTFSASSATSIAWSSGTFKSAKGTTYSIEGGSATSISSRIYIYLDIAISTTEYQTTTTATTAVGNGKVLIGTAINGTSEASFEIFGGSGGIKVPGTSICAATITGDIIAANTIAAGNMTVSTLSSITANMGTITAGTIVGGTYKTAVSGDRIEISTSGIYNYDDEDGVHFSLTPGSDLGINRIIGIEEDSGAIEIDATAIWFWPPGGNPNGIELYNTIDNKTVIAGISYQNPILQLATPSSNIEIAAGNALQASFSTSAITLGTNITLDLNTNSAYFLPRVVVGTVPGNVPGELLVFNNTYDNTWHLVFYDGSNYHDAALT